MHSSHTVTVWSQTFYVDLPDSLTFCLQSVLCSAPRSPPLLCSTVSKLRCSCWFSWIRKRIDYSQIRLSRNVTIPVLLTWTLCIDPFPCRCSINLLFISLTSVSLVYLLTEDQTVTEDRGWSPETPQRRILSRSSSALFKLLCLRSQIHHLPECSGFLLQLSLFIEMQPQKFVSERSKVAFLISLLSGRALLWA